MRKRHAFRKHSAEQTYQPSDAVSVLAIAATAIILVLSLFAMERVAGVPVSVHGESASAPSDATTMTRRTANRKQSLAAQRAASRKAKAAASGSASSAQACSDNACSNLLSTFFQGDPSCMRDQRCVNSVYRIISKQPCSASDGCSSLAAAYAFFYTNQACITSFTDECRTGVAQAIRWAQ